MLYTSMPREMKSDFVMSLSATPDEENVSAFGLSNEYLEESLRNVESLTQNVRELLDDAGAVIDSEGLRHQVETLERCADSYRRGMIAARMLHNFGEDWLQDMQVRLQNALDDYARFDGEGGSYMAENNRNTQDEPIKRLRRASRNVNEALANIEHIFAPHELPHPAMYASQNPTATYWVAH